MEGRTGCRDGKGREVRDVWREVGRRGKGREGSGVSHAAITTTNINMHYYYVLLLRISTKSK